MTKEMTKGMINIKKYNYILICLICIFLFTSCIETNYIGATTSTYSNNEISINSSEPKNLESSENNSKNSSSDSNNNSSSNSNSSSKSDQNSASSNQRKTENSYPWEDDSNIPDLPWQIPEEPYVNNGEDGEGENGDTWTLPTIDIPTKPPFYGDEYNIPDMPGVLEYSEPDLPINIK